MVRAIPVTAVTTNVNYVFTDHLDTPRVITRASDNQMVWRWDSADPFGAAQPNANPAGLGVFTYNPRFPGQLYDAETGLYYNYHRNYAPQIGSYTQSDPIGLGGGINTYAYVGGNPVNAVDPTGEFLFLAGLGGLLEGGGATAVLAGLGEVLGGAGIGYAAANAISGGMEASKHRSDSVHPDEQELLDATCDDVSWAIPELRAKIAELKNRYKDFGGGNFEKNPYGPGHPKRIEILEKKLKWLEACSKNCP
ncbi:MAG: RHS repeat-associated core domain-containing protein [Methyloglobulus sp.]|nr:RHS repeat-associated core domain-containing protein [Methyloglobulus sp.]